jgi:hypothetical protein
MPRRRTAELPDELEPFTPSRPFSAFLAECRKWHSAQTKPTTPTMRPWERGLIGEGARQVGGHQKMVEQQKI